MDKTLKVSGMHCKSCGMIISESLAEIPGIKNISVDHTKGIVKFSCDDESKVAEVKKAIEKEGYKVA